MPTVNSNTAAQFALNKMNQTERDMTTAMERLSSGKRINHAGDDAAGAAIADRMTAQIKGLKMASKNATISFPDPGNYPIIGEYEPPNIAPSLKLNSLSPAGASPLNTSVNPLAAGQPSGLKVESKI